MNENYPELYCRDCKESTRHYVNKLCYTCMFCGNIIKRTQTHGLSSKEGKK